VIQGPSVGVWVFCATRPGNPADPVPQDQVIKIPVSNQHTAAVGIRRNRMSPSVPLPLLPETGMGVQILGCKNQSPQSTAQNPARPCRARIGFLASQRVPGRIYDIIGGAHGHQTGGMGGGRRPVLKCAGIRGLAEDDEADAEREGLPTVRRHHHAHAKRGSRPDAAGRQARRREAKGLACHGERRDGRGSNCGSRLHRQLLCRVALPLQTTHLGPWFWFMCRAEMEWSKKSKSRRFTLQKSKSMNRCASFTRRGFRFDHLPYNKKSAGGQVIVGFVLESCLVGWLGARV
jgi:hypothetical protein